MEMLNGLTVCQLKMELQNADPNGRPYVWIDGCYRQFTGVDDDVDGVTLMTRGAPVSVEQLVNQLDKIKDQNSHIIVWASGCKRTPIEVDVNGEKGVLIDIGVPTW
jgi:hypothetical protein